MIRLVFLISSLNRGGAEKQLTLLVRNLDRTKFAITVVTIYDGGGLADELRNLENVTVVSVGKGGRTDNLFALVRLAALIRRLRPDIVHGYLDVGNVLALVTGRMARAGVVWGIRASSIDLTTIDRTSRFYLHAASRVSRWPDAIIANSQAGRDDAVSKGYPADKVVVIPNGFDTTRFAPDPQSGLRMRQRWSIPPDAPLIGLVARLDPIKDHPTFLRAAARLRQTNPDVRFVCVGDGPAGLRAELQALSESLGLADCLVWAGEETDMPAVQNALTIATSSSISEGFSNTLGEAMACGVPCVATDVGDASHLLADTGRLIDVGNAQALAIAWDGLLNLPVSERRALGEAARARIVAQYSLQALAQRTEAVLEGLRPGV